MISPTPIDVHYETRSKRYVYEFRPSQLFVGIVMLIFSVSLPLLFYIFEIEVKGKKIQKHPHNNNNPSLDEPYEFPQALLLFPLLFGSIGIFTISSFPWSRLIIDPIKNTCVWEQVRLPIFFSSSSIPIPFLVSKRMTFTLDQLCEETSVQDSGWRRGKSKTRKRGSQGHHNTDGPVSNKKIVYEVKIRILKSQKEVDKLETAKTKAIARFTQESEGYPDPNDIKRVEEDFEKNKVFSIVVAREDNEEVLKRIKSEWDEFLHQLKVKSGEQWEGKKSD